MAAAAAASAAAHIEQAAQQMFMVYLTSAAAGTTLVQQQQLGGLHAWPAAAGAPAPCLAWLHALHCVGLQQLLPVRAATRIPAHCAVVQLRQLAW